MDILFPVNEQDNTSNYETVEYSITFENKTIEEGSSEDDEYSIEEVDFSDVAETGRIKSFMLTLQN